MKIETANTTEQVATPELIRELVRDDAQRGEFMIMMDDADDERFVQIAGDYDDVGGLNDGCFDLEYREGKDGALYHCIRRVGAADVERVFLEELVGRGEWRNGFTWERVDDYGKTAFSRDRWLGAASGIFVAVLCSVPFALMLYALLAVDYSSNWRMMLVPGFGTLFFGLGVFMGIRDALRHWRVVSRLQTILGEMSEEERKEFDAAIAQSDVELRTDESGKTHVLPLDH